MYTFYILYLWENFHLKHLPITNINDYFPPPPPSSMLVNKNKKKYITHTGNRLYTGPVLASSGSAFWQIS